MSDQTARGHGLGNTWHQQPIVSDRNEHLRDFRVYQFSTRQLARLLQLRSDALDARLGIGRWTADILWTE
jgi:hypothetical protein